MVIPTYRSVHILLSAAPLALSVSVVARAQSLATTSTVPDIPYTKYVLRNGLTLLVHEDHKASIAAAGIDDRESRRSP